MTGDSEGRIPVPDPSTLTTEQLDKGLHSLSQLIESKLDGATQAMALQFELVERQRVEQKADTKAAVDAALTAQKEAVREQTIASDRAIAKSEAATSKQLEQLSTTFTTALVGVTQSLSDLKERVGRIESVKAGGQQAYSGLYMFGAFIVMIVVIAGAVAAFGGR